MSCPSHVPCDEVLARLWEFIDHELTPDNADRIRQHLAVCAHCLPQYAFQRAFVVFLRRQREAPAPPELRRRVFRHLLGDAGHDVHGH